MGNRLPQSLKSTGSGRGFTNREAKRLAECSRLGELGRMRRHVQRVSKAGHVTVRSLSEWRALRAHQTAILVREQAERARVLAQQARQQMDAEANRQDNAMNADYGSRLDGMF